MALTQDMPLHDLREQMAAWPAALRDEEGIYLHKDVPALTRLLCIPKMTLFPGTTVLPLTSYVAPRPEARHGLSPDPPPLVYSLVMNGMPPYPLVLRVVFSEYHKCKCSAPAQSSWVTGLGLT